MFHLKKLLLLLSYILHLKGKFQNSFVRSTWQCIVKGVIILCFMKWVWVEIITLTWDVSSTRLNSLINCVEKIYQRACIETDQSVSQLDLSCSCSVYSNMVASFASSTDVSTWRYIAFRRDNQFARYVVYLSQSDCEEVAPIFYISSCIFWVFVLLCGRDGKTLTEVRA